jgi:hypothetical protein
MNRLRGALAAAFVVFATTPALAAAAASAVAVLSPTPSPTGERARQLARDVLVASGADSRLANVSDATMSDGLRALGAALPKAKPEWRPAMEQSVRDEMKAFGELLFEGNIDIYARRFTEAQLADMLAFYRTPSGQALANQSAVITRDRLALSHSYGAELLPHMVAAVCAKYPCPGPAQGPPKQAPGVTSGVTR